VSGLEPAFGCGGGKRTAADGAGATIGEHPDQSYPWKTDQSVLASPFRSWSLATRKNTPLRVEKRLRPVVPFGRNRVGPITRNPAITRAWGCSGRHGCTVWQQFVYSTDYDCGSCGTAGVFIQFWLLNYGACPNSDWTQSGENCWINSKVTPVPDFPITDLESLSLHAAAHAGGQGCVAVYDDTGAGWDACASDGVLDISSVWDKTEFGIFGDGGGSQAQFGFGTNFAQLLQVNDGSGAAPTCLKNAGTTGETNNLNLSPKCDVLVGNGLYPRIRFTESNPFKSPIAPNIPGQIFPGQGLTPGHSWQSQDGRFTLAMQTDSNLVLYEGGTALWWTGTVGQDVAWVIMQADGNLVLYYTSENPVWNSGTGGFETAYLAIQNDGNLVIYLPAGPAVWASNTCCH
jgi:hypothetical protein